MDDHEILIVEQNRYRLSITLNRPKFHNAINSKMLAELKGLFRNLASEHELRVVILTGKGKSFCSGADLTMMQESAIV